MYDPKDYVKAHPNPALIDEKTAEQIFTADQIKEAKKHNGFLSDKYILNKQS